MYFKAHLPVYRLNYAPINVKPQGGGGGGRGYPREIDWECLPLGRDFDV